MLLYALSPIPSTRGCRHAFLRNDLEGGHQSRVLLPVRRSIPLAALHLYIDTCGGLDAHVPSQHAHRRGHSICGCRTLGDLCRTSRDVRELKCLFKMLLNFNTGHLYSTGYNKFVFDPNVHEVCTKSAVGFQLDENVANALLAFFFFGQISLSLQLIFFTFSHAPKLDGMHNKPHTALLVLYPISTPLFPLPQHIALNNKFCTATALSIFGCIFQVTVHLATRRGNRSLLQGMTSNGVTWMFWYSSFTTLLIFFAVIVQISIVAYAKIHVAAIRATVRDLSFHWGNTVRCYF
jgi:hypothetical protein